MKTWLLGKDECRISSPFWDRYIQLVRDKVIPYQWEILNDQIEDAEPSHAIDNFRIAAGDMPGHFYGQVFQDSDVYKWLESVGNILLLQRDPELEQKADSVINIVARAQQPDGYLDTYYIIEAPEKRWTDVLECHELYCAGHLIEGAVAYYMATGKKQIYEVACKLADHLLSVFGTGEDQMHGYPGHQEIELALLRLADVSGNKRYMELAQYFIDTRGTNSFFEEEFDKRNHISFWANGRTEDPNQYYNQYPYTYYNQFHKPVREQDKAVGHAVRGVYMYTAMADLASRSEDELLGKACERIWNNIVNKQMYITGGIGSTHSGEAFTANFDLPNDTVYAETCASIGLIFFAQKMLKSHIHHTYGDVMEQALYNTVLGGMNHEGNRFFYVNPLKVVPDVCIDNPERNHVKPVRQRWFACACCPPNIARLIGGLWNYIYTTGNQTIYTHLYVGSKAQIRLDKGMAFVEQETEYPWNNEIHMRVKTQFEDTMTMALRIPGWCKNYSITVNGEDTDGAEFKEGYIYLTDNWSEGAEVKLVFEMTPRIMQANHRVSYDIGRAAVMRGPLVYCLEEKDNGAALEQLALDIKSELIEEIVDTEECGEYVQIQCSGTRRIPQGDENVLYSEYSDKKEIVTLTYLPYFLWNNRGEGEMEVWVRVGD